MGFDGGFGRWELRPQCRIGCRYEFRLDAIAFQQRISGTIAVALDGQSAAEVMHFAILSDF